MSWAERAAANLLPLSKEKSDLANALREWRYTGDFHDLEAPIENCQLCDHPDIRYQFEIRNLLTGNTLLIGSECINRFGIAATDEEGRLARTERRVAASARQSAFSEPAIAPCLLASAAIRLATVSHFALIVLPGGLPSFDQDGTKPQTISTNSR